MGMAGTGVGTVDMGEMVEETMGVVIMEIEIVMV